MGDIYRNGGTLGKRIERCVNQLHEDDQGDVGRYLDDLLSNGYSDLRIQKIASTLSLISRSLRLKDATKEDIKRYVAQLERSDYSEWTRYGYKTILRGYMRWLGKDETVDWMKIKRSKNGTLPEEILTERDIKGLSSAAYTSRDRVFVLALYESSCRIGEFLPLKIKHLNFDKHGVVFHVTGKTGGRRVRLVASTLPLQRWLEEHPDKNDPEAYLWTQIPGTYHPADKVKKRHLSYGFVCKLLKELANNAKVKKKVNPHAFRHARATFMAKHLKEPEMREFFGWGKDSEMPAIYVHLSGRDVDDSVLSIYGIKESTERQNPEFKTFDCPRCQEKNDSTQLYCGRCGLPFTEDVVKEERLEGVMVDFIKLLSERVPEAKGIFQEMV